MLYFDLQCEVLKIKIQDCHLEPQSKIKKKPIETQNILCASGVAHCMLMHLSPSIRVYAKKDIRNGLHLMLRMAICGC